MKENYRDIIIFILLIWAFVIVNVLLMPAFG